MKTLAVYRWARGPIFIVYLRLKSYADIGLLGVGD